MIQSRWIALVGCGKSKLSHPAPARYLYTGNLFRAASEWAEANADEWYILSALHGLVDPNKTLAPYDVSMGMLSPYEKKSWGFATRSALMQAGLWDANIVFLAGKEYERAVLGAPHVTKPLEGLMLGERLAWFKREAGR